jgi:di/tricarboxylate transporter
MTPAALSLLILAVTVVLFIWNRFPVEVVALGCALTLLFTGLIDNSTVFSGFGDSVIIFIAALFVVSEGLEASGVTAWISGVVSDRSGGTYTRVLLTVMALAAVVSAVITINGAAAALLPVTVAVARRASLRPSRVLIPLAFACSAGALLTLSGSPVNVIVQDASKQAGAGGFGYLEFALIGVPLVVVTMTICVVLGPRLLPNRTPTQAPTDFSDYLATIAEHWAADYRIWLLTVPIDSAALGAQPAAITDSSGLTLIGTQRPSGRITDDGHRLEAGDVLAVSGEESAVLDFAQRQQFSIRPVMNVDQDDLITREAGVAEIVIPPRSDSEGASAFPGMDWHGLTVLSVRRRNVDCGLRVTALTPGDMLLMHGPWRAIDRLDNKDVLVVESADALRRQTVPLGPSAPWAIAIVIAMVVLLASGITTPAVAAVLAAGSMVLTRVVRLERAYRAIPWQTLILIGGLIPLSAAISSSGAADMIARPVVEAVGAGNPILVLAALFVLTAVLGQFISNVATVLIVIPIALATAAETGISVQPVLMTVAVAGAAALLTPIATPANLIVMNPGGYRFGDYWRLGLVLMLAWLALALVLIPIFWPL